MPTLHDTDFYSWTQQQADLLRSGNFAALDITNLIDELTDMGMSERRELESRLRVLLAHLLKWQFQYQLLSNRWKEFEAKSWRNTIINQRTELSILFRKYPGTKRFLAPAIVESYKDARELAAKESGLPIATFPKQCIYSLDQILDDNYYPQLN